jgi:hypothetical protein
MTRSALTLLSIGVATIAACAQQAASAPASAASSGRECFNARNISSFTAQGESTIDIQAGVRRYYRLELAGVCTNVNWARKVAVVTRSGSSWICQGFDADLVIADPGIGPQRCLVSSVRRLTDAEARALKYYK